MPFDSQCDLRYSNEHFMAQQETEHLRPIVTSRAVSDIAEPGVAALIKSGQRQPVERLASATKPHESSLDRILCRMAGV